MINNETYAVLKKYIDDTLEGGGALKGKNATISSIVEITGGHRVTYQWFLDNGTIQTETMDVMNGLNGANGINGQNGSDGRDGRDGSDGRDGVDGITPSFSIGSVQSGVSPSVNITGTDAAPVLNFVLAKGDRGEIGPAGADGADGKSFEIKARFATEADLLAAYPSGPDNPSDAYFVGTTNNPDLYVWLSTSSEWYNNGPIAGVKGDKGDPGNDGYSPSASVTKSGGISTITITDKTGTTTAQVMDGTETAIATTASAGIVKPDGITILVDQDGTIHGAFILEGGIGVSIDNNEINANTSTFRGTLDEWDALTSDQQAQYTDVLTPDGDVDFKDVYSTSEVKTGKVWIDGRDIYRIVMPVFSDTETTAHAIASGTDYIVPNSEAVASGIDYMINGYARGTSSDEALDMAPLIGYVRVYGANFNWTGIKFYSMNNAGSLLKVYVVIEYVKKSN